MKVHFSPCQTDNFVSTFSCMPSSGGFVEMKYQESKMNERSSKNKDHPKIIFKIIVTYINLTILTHF